MTSLAQGYSYTETYSICRGQVGNACFRYGVEQGMSVRTAARNCHDGVADECFMDQVSKESFRIALMIVRIELVLHAILPLVPKAKVYATQVIYAAMA